MKKLWMNNLKKGMAFIRQDGKILTICGIVNDKYSGQTIMIHHNYESNNKRSGVKLINLYSPAQIRTRVMSRNLKRII